MQAIIRKVVFLDLCWALADIVSSLACIEDGFDELTDDGQWNSDLDATGWNFTVMKIQISFWSGIDIVKI